MEFGAVSEPPKLIKMVEPIYPVPARETQIEGVVVIRVLVDTGGQAEKIEVVQSHPMLDEAIYRGCRAI